MTCVAIPFPGCCLNLPAMALATANFSRRAILATNFLIKASAQGFDGTRVALNQSRQLRFSIGGDVVMSTTAGVARLALKVGGIASVLGGLAFIYFSFGIGGETPKKEASASATSSAAPSQKPIHAMNLALGDMVFLAQDLGYSVKTSKDTTFESNKVALRIESHLQKLREIYRQESGKNPTLVGSILLQFNIAASGEVSEVKELSSRLNDSEFKKAMIAEVAKWSFSEIVSENVTVTCPLLFVREGMDITTLVLWEKSLGNVSEKPVLAATASKPVQAVA